MKNKITKVLAVILSLSMVFGFSAMTSAAEPETNEDGAEYANDLELVTMVEAENVSEVSDTVSADDAIEGIKVLGTVDWDCAKATAIVVEYNVDLTDADVSNDTYEINDYGTSLVPIADSTTDAGQGSYCANGNGIQPGAIMNVYVNDEPEMTETPSGSGKYVIIEINTDYFLPFFPGDWRIVMNADVKQIKDITAGDTLITAATEAVKNYEEIETKIKDSIVLAKYALEGTYEIEGLEGYELHMLADDAAKYDENSVWYDQIEEAFHCTNCYDETDGEYWDFDLAYALYVPEDYDPDGNYALILHYHDASSMGTNPLNTLTEARGPYNYASDEFQQLFKDQGLDGCIVVAPSIAEKYTATNSNTGEVEENHIMRVTTDNWTVTCVCPGTWQLMDYLTDTYSIDTDRIYGEGQSMGGMSVLEMAAQRDNYFAAIMANSCKWGNNTQKESIYAGKFGATTHGYFSAPTQAEDEEYSMIPELDADGNASNYENWYYRISDDNICFVRTVHEMKELSVLYKDLCGVEIPEVEYSVDYGTTHEQSLADRNAIAEELFSMENPTGIYELTLTDDVSHNACWMLGHDTWTVYEWLAQRTRTEENDRDKLWNLANDFELADEQLNDYEHSPENNEGGIPTGKLGSGTNNFNSYIDEDHYSGWVLNEDGTTSQIGWTTGTDGTVYNAAGVVIVNGKINITTQPENVYAAVGDKAALSVDAEGDGLAYQWYYTVDGENWIKCSSSASTKANFTFKMYKNFSGRIYKCVVTDANGYYLETEEVMVSTPFAITAQPEDIEAAAGDAAALTVAATGEGLSYQWSYTVDDGETWKDCTSSGAVKANFKFKMYKNFNGRQYKCTVTDAAGTVLESEIVSITVK